MLYLSLYFKTHRELLDNFRQTGDWEAWLDSLVKKTGIIPATVNKALGHLEQLGIVRELTAQKRNRLFNYGGYTGYNESRDGVCNNTKFFADPLQNLSFILLRHL